MLLQVLYQTIILAVNAQRTPNLSNSLHQAKKNLRPILTQGNSTPPLVLRRQLPSESLEPNNPSRSQPRQIIKITKTSSPVKRIVNDTPLLSQPLLNPETLNSRSRRITSHRHIKNGGVSSSGSCLRHRLAILLTRRSLSTMRLPTVNMRVDTARDH